MTYLIGIRWDCLAEPDGPPQATAEPASCGFTGGVLHEFCALGSSDAHLFITQQVQSLGLSLVCARGDPPCPGWVGREKQEGKEVSKMVARSEKEDGE